MEKHKRKELWRNISQSLFFWPGLFLITASLLTVIWAIDAHSALGIWRAYFLQPFLLYLILISTCLRREDWHRLFWGLGIGVLGLASIAITQYFTGWWSPTWEWTLPETRRVTGVYTSPNALGLFVAPIFLLYLGWILWQKKSKDPVSKKLFAFQVLVCFASLLSIYLAVSRGALLAVALGTFFLGMVFWSKKNTLLIGALVVAFLFSFSPIRQDILDLSAFRVESGQSRLALYQGSWELIRAQPLRGLGLASFAERFEEVRPVEFTEELIYPHQFFLNFWIETGILGLLAVLWIILLLIKTAWARAPGFHYIFLSALIAVWAHGMIDVSYFKNDLAFLTWFLLAGYAGAGGRLVGRQ